MKLFIRDPESRVPAIGLGYQFVANCLWVEDDDVFSINRMSAMNCEEIAEDDPRYDFIISEGWSRQAAKRFPIENPPQPVENPPQPVEEEQPAE